MKMVDASISMLFGEDGLKIEVRDSPSRITFLEIHMTPEQVSMAFSRLMNTDCKMHTRELENVGKKLEVKKIEFPISERTKEAASAELEDFIPSGWGHDNGFSSQGSLKTKDGIHYANTIIRRWV